MRIFKTIDEKIKIQLLKDIIGWFLVGLFVLFWIVVIHINRYQ